MITIKAVVYGAGNVGRGFIGVLLSQSGYTVTFIDVNNDLVSSLNRARRYPVRILDGDHCEDIEVMGINAIRGQDISAAAAAIAQADILATAVGAKALPHIIPSLVTGLRTRWKLSLPPLNILICENLMDANHILRELIYQELTTDERNQLDETAGLVETSIGRMIPVQTIEMQDGDPLRICVERYGFLPVDQDAFKDGIPQIKRMVPFSPFDFYLKRKLYLHNMAHAVCAYIGMYTGIEYIWEAIEESSIRLIVKEAMCESISAIAKEYDFPMQELLPHANDLLIRFSNRALGDTCSRVGGDPGRKLGAFDRLIGAAGLCQKHGIPPVYIAVGAAGALYQLLKEQELAQNTENASAALQEASGLAPEDDLGGLIIDQYNQYCSGTNPGKLIKTAEMMKKRFVNEII